MQKIQQTEVAAAKSPGGGHEPPSVATFRSPGEGHIPPGV